MSIRSTAPRALLLSIAALVTPACGDDDGTTRPPSPDAAMADRDASSPPPDASAPTASWDLESNLTVNGTPLDEGIRSAIAQHQELDSGPGLTLTLTSAPDYCALVRADGCIADGNVVVRVEIHGVEPGRYTLGSSVEPTPGTFSLIHQLVDRDCTGAGFGPTEGTLTVLGVDGGAASIALDTTLSFVGASSRLAGTVTAPFCD